MSCFQLTSIIPFLFFQFQDLSFQLLSFLKFNKPLGLSLTLQTSTFTILLKLKSPELIKMRIRVVFAETGYEKQRGVCERVRVDLWCHRSTLHHDTQRPHSDPRRPTHTHTHTHTQWTRPPDATVTVTERIHLSVVIRLRCVADNAAHSPPQMYPDIDG